MESTNLHGQKNPPLEPPPPSLSSSYAVAATTHSSWTPPNITLNAGNNLNNRSVEEANPRSRDELGYHHHHWTSEIDSDHQNCLTTTNFPKFSDMLINTPSPNSSMEDYGLATTNPTTTNHKDHMHALNEKLLFKTLFSGDLYSTNNSNNPQNYPINNDNSFGVPLPSRGMIYPSINISNYSNPTTAVSSSSLDLLTSSARSSQGLVGLSRFADNLSFSLDHHMHHHHHHPNERSSCSSNSSTNNASLQLSNGMAEAKRGMASSQSQTAPKKSRSEPPRPSCPPFKVRKEKLGDRIAALQQLVAPFGKTDTASVLMEAIGYIKFLQGQVETLSVPYMKSSQNHTNRMMQGGSGIGEANGEPKQDLRSRGLCLVPLSCMSYIAGDGSSEVWQQPNFGGTT